MNFKMQWIIIAIAKIRRKGHIVKFQDKLPLYNKWYENKMLKNGHQTALRSYLLDKQLLNSYYPSCASH